MKTRVLTLAALLFATFAITACSDATAPRGDDENPCGGLGSSTCEK